MLKFVKTSQEFLGRTLRVNFANKPKPKEPLYPETEHKLFVGNLSWSVTSESLIQAFQEYGNVVGARVLYDGETGRSRGYGFVCYSTKSEMETALASLNNVVYYTSSLHSYTSFALCKPGLGFCSLLLHKSCTSGTRRTSNARKLGSRKTFTRLIEAWEGYENFRNGAKEMKRGLV